MMHFENGKSSAEQELARHVTETLLLPEAISE